MAKILVVEDNNEINQMLVELLSESYHVVGLFGNGRITFVSTGIS